MTPHTVWQLSRMAGCYDPDSLVSPGAEFLLRIEADTVVAIEEAEPSDDNSDIAHQVADTAVPIGTFDKWRTFVDLGAWEQDVSDYINWQSDDPNGTDMTTQATVALYVIGNQLASALIEQNRR